MSLITNFDQELIERLITKIDSGDNDWLNTSYVCSYPSLLAFFQKKVLTVEILIQGTHMVYGWMPTILDLRNKLCKPTPDLPFLLEAIELIKNLPRNNPDKNQLSELKKITNNSTIGLSKLLHFIYPETYPIWDSVVSVALGGPKYWQSVDNIANYIAYHELMNSKEAKGLGMIVKTKIWPLLNKAFYKNESCLSDIRALEMTIYALKN